MPEEASCCRGGWSSPGQRRAAEKEGAWRGHTFSRLWGKELRLGVRHGGAAGARCLRGGPPGHAAATAGLPHAGLLRPNSFTYA